MNTLQSKLSKKHLKRGLYKNALHKDPIEKYVIENASDLEKFFKAFPIVGSSKLMNEGYINAIKRGDIVIADDPHPVHQLNTYCYESTPNDNPHPSEYFRIELIDY